MKKLIVFAAFISSLSLGFTSCGDDEDSSDPECVVCEGIEANGLATPDFEICEGENGNALLSGIDTGIDFQTYVDSQALVTTCE